MHIRPLRRDDLPHLVELTIDTFGPFYEDSFRPHVGDIVFVHEHGSWRDDYRRQVPALHHPGQGKHVAVAEAHPGHPVVGYVAWNVDPARKHGEIEILAVAAGHRRGGAGSALCDHALGAMRADGVEVVAIGTGGDPFHAPARGLYESLGFTPFPGVYYYKAL
ncbi:MAG TPA: GNAT family N-acetyltransferase [Jiangellales bacterium]|nr:GNAT family N-acetyltransferase [Jiangellales bacterium]